jgi:tetratricopeptide (TPR) repeat protein
MTAADRRISAAQGYLELGLHEDALAELEKLPAMIQRQADALDVYVLYHMHLQQWEQALQHARELCTVAPEHPGGYIHAAYCLHELGRTGDAAICLEKGPRALKKQAVYYYNLGCYYTRLGNLPKAVRLLEKSFEMDDSLRKTAQHDPDLLPLFSQLP